MDNIIETNIGVIKSFTNEGKPSRYYIQKLSSDKTVIYVRQVFLTKNKALIESIDKELIVAKIIRKTKWGYLVMRDMSFTLGAVYNINTIVKANEKFGNVITIVDNSNKSE